MAHYQPLPTDEQQSREGSRDCCYEVQVDSGASDHEQPEDIRIRRKQTQRKIHFACIGLFVVFYMSYFVARSVLAPPAHGGMEGVAKKCHDAIHRLGLTGHLDCGALHRNMSTVGGGKLHSNYTLPSGDQIPAVALGKLNQKRWEITVIQFLAL